MQKKLRFFIGICNLQVEHSNKHFQTFDLKTSEYFLDEVKTVLSTTMSLATTALQEKHNQQQQQQISIFLQSNLF